MQDVLKHLIKLSNLRSYKFLKWEHTILKEEINKNLGDYESTGINKLGGGVYRMYNENKEIIYVGKSNDIHRRLLQHIGKRTNSAYFIDEVVKIEWHQENNPIWQTLLEGIFIAYHCPKYNDEVKDYKKLLEAQK